MSETSFVGSNERSNSFSLEIPRFSTLSAVSAIFGCNFKQGDDNALGDLNLIPLEVIHLMFSHLSIRELSILSMTSKSVRKEIEEFCIKPKNGFKNIVPKDLLNGSYIDNKRPELINEELRRYHLFRELGLLLKRTTCLYPTRERLQIVIDFIKKVHGPLPSVADVQNIGTGIRFRLKCIGYLLHTVITGWDESECEVVFNFIGEHFQIGPIVNKCLLSKVGHCKNDEYFVRSYYRLICLDPCPTLSDRAFWLSLILRLPLVEDQLRTESRAKLLMMIYGPLIGPDPKELPTIAWWDLTDSFFIDEGLKDIAFAVHLLHGHLKQPNKSEQEAWTNEVVAVIDKLIALPDRWLFENIATFLYHCGKEVIKLELKKRLTDGHLSDVANYIVYLTLISQKFKEDANWIIELIDTVFAMHTCQNMKRSLILEIPIAFNEALSDIEHLVDADDERDVTELHDMINAQSALMKALFQKAYPFSNEKCADNKSVKMEE